MAAKKFKPSKLTLFFGLCLFGIILLLLPGRITNRINFTFIDIFDFFLNIGSSASRYPGVEIDPRYYVSRHEHDKLWVAYSNLQAELTEERRRVEKLGQLRLTEPNPNTSLILGQIVNRRNGELIINRGSEHKLLPGQYVLGDNAIIGIVSEVSPTISSIKLITSPQCRLRVKISAPESNSYFGGTMLGDDKDGALILNIPKKYPITVGSNVYAAKEACLLESPRIIGKVSICQTDEANPVVWQIAVNPVYDTKDITDVAVIVINNLK